MLEVVFEAVLLLKGFARWILLWKLISRSTQAACHLHFVQSWEPVLTMNKALRLLS